MRLSIIIIISLITQTLFAQQELGLFLQENAWQTNRLNPAAFPKGKKLIIGLPGLVSNGFLSNVKLGDIEEKDENGNTIFNANKAIPFLESSNLVRANSSIETVSLGLQLNQWHFQFGHAIQYHAFIDYSKTLAQLIWEGNSQFIGQEVPFGTNFQVSGYHEWSVGAAYEIVDNINIGGRLKYLSGIGDASTDPDRTNLSLFTDEEFYALRLNGDFLVNSAGFINYNGFSDININSDFGTFNTDQLFSANNGLAFDLGISGRVANWYFAASVLDIGKINWEDDVTNYEISGNQEYQGLDILQSVTDSSIPFPSILDSLEAAYEPTQTANAYSNKLLNRAYGYLGYQVSKQWKVGATIYLGSFQEELYTAAGIGAQGQIVDWLSLGAMYSYRYDSFSNLGINAHVNLGPVQLLAATDNIIGLANLKNASNANFRLGLNLAFGQGEPGDTQLNEQDFFRD